MNYLNDIAKSLVSKETIISLLIVDLNYNVLMYNEKLNKTIGDIEVKKGDSFYTLLDFYGEKVKEAIEKSFYGKFSEVEHKSIRDDRFFNSIIQPLRDKNNIIYGVYITSKDITKRINHHNSLEYNERELRSLYDNAPLGYQSLDENGRFLYVNDTLSNMLGYSKEELIGEWIGDFLCINELATLKEKFSKFKEKGVIKRNVKMLTKSGNVITIMFDGKIAYKDDGSFKQTHCILRDVTEKEKMMEIIIKSKQDLQLILNSTAEAIYGVDLNGNCTFVNSGFLKILGYEDEKYFIGKNIHDMIYRSHENGRELSNIETGELSEKIGVLGERVLRKKDNTSINVEFSSNPKFENGKIIGAVVTFKDLTERIAREKKISYLSYRDPLTKLYNRRFFEEQIKRLDNPRNLPLSIIMGDVNGLKLVNDAFGHKAGDKLLRTIGDIISKSTRGNDVAARWGGDEFIILLPTSGADAAEILINRIQKKIKEASFEYGSLSISFGADTKKEEHEDINEIFTSAEKLMYQNKLLEIDSVRGETINTIMNTLFEKSIEVKEHSMRVSEFAVLIAEKMGLSKTNINDIKTMGMIHDIGKIAIDLNILNKPSELEDEERTIIKQHPLSGSRMLGTSHEYTRLAAGVLHHHERIDGKGYPNGITGDQIPLESKIIAVADAFDAMTAKRPYRLTPLSLDEAIVELQKYSGTQFDEAIVDVFVSKVLKGRKSF